MKRLDGSWREVLLLYDALRSGAVSVAPRLKGLLEKLDPDCETILGAGSRSLMCEVEGDLASAVNFRKAEVALIRRLHEEATGQAWEAYALDGYTTDVLAARESELAALIARTGGVNDAEG